jgi:RimJ/RimL family protein N-acetyltransferase
MTTPYWPLTGLRLATPRLELRWPTLADLDALAGLAAGGVHDPAVQPFMNAWTDADPAERAQRTLQYHWRQWASWQPADWSLNLVAVLDGAVVATQGMEGRDFAVLREVSTGSWVGREHHGQGISTEMRAAMLHLAFAGLGARYATSAAFDDNAASLAVSRKLGYADDGIEHCAVRGRPVVSRRLRLDRAGWEAHRAVPVEISGLPPCQSYFGNTQQSVPAVTR